MCCARSPGVDDDGDGVRDAGETTVADSALTDVAGGYSLSVLPGSYVLCEVAQAEWEQTAPSGNACGGGEVAAGGHALTLAAAETTSRSFGNRLRRATVSGIYGAAAAQTLLAAIGRSDGTRASVLANLRRTKLSTTLGTVSFRPNGDPNFSLGFTAYRMGADGLTEFRVIRAQMPVVRAISR